MELPKIAETLIKDTLAVTKFVGERAIHGAWGTLAHIVHHQPDESNIKKGEE